MKIDSYHIQYNIHTETVIARRPNGPTWQSVSKTHEYQRISDFWVTDSHVAALLGMTGKGLSTRWTAAGGRLFFYTIRNIKIGFNDSYQKHPISPENPAVSARNRKESKPQINLWKSRWKVWKGGENADVFCALGVWGPACPGGGAKKKGGGEEEIKKRDCRAKKFLVQ